MMLFLNTKYTKSTKDLYVTQPADFFQPSFVKVLNNAIFTSSTFVSFVLELLIQDR